MTQCRIIRGGDAGGLAVALPANPLDGGGAAPLE
jgi:hypothetical protein